MHLGWGRDSGGCWSHMRQGHCDFLQKRWVGWGPQRPTAFIYSSTNQQVGSHMCAPIFIAHHWKQSQNPDTYYFVWDGQRRWNVSKKFFAIWANHWKQIVCSLKVTNLFLFLNLKTHTNKQYTIIISLLLNRFNASFYFFGFCLLIMVYFVKLQQSKVTINGVKSFRVKMKMLFSPHLNRENLFFRFRVLLFKVCDLGLPWWYSG